MTRYVTVSSADYEQAVRLALDHAHALDAAAGAMAAQAWVGGGAPAFAAELGSRRRALLAALEAGLATIAARLDPAPRVPSLHSPLTTMNASAGAFAGVDLAQLDRLIAGLARAGESLPPAGRRFAALGAPSGATVGAIGEWAGASVTDLRRRLALLQEHPATPLAPPSATPPAMGSPAVGPSLTSDGTGFLASPAGAPPPHTSSVGASTPRTSPAGSPTSGTPVIPAALVAFGVFGEHARSAVTGLLDRAAAGDGRALAAVLDRQRQGTDPTLAARVNTWWRTLDQPARLRLGASRPQLVGALDGVPARVRDQANRAFLAAEKVRLAALLTVVPDDMSLKLAWPAVLDRTLLALEHIRMIESGLAMGGRNGRPPALLLAFDLSALGQVTLSFGDPDTADRVVAYVPGFNTRLSTFTGDFNRAAVLWDQAHYLAPGQELASIAWLGYRAPQLDALALRQDMTVAGPGAADLGARPLAAFTDGLRATHVPARTAKLTVLGHSYGSLVTGKAALLRPGRLADDLVFVGSPGVGVERAEQLGVPASRVWAGEAAGDPVGDLARFGDDPCDTAFGARRFYVEDGPFYLTFAAHSDYWTPDSKSLKNLANIVSGRYHDITTNAGD